MQNRLSSNTRNDGQKVEQLISPTVSEIFNQYRQSLWTKICSRMCSGRRGEDSQVDSGGQDTNTTTTTSVFKAMWLSKLHVTWQNDWLGRKGRILPVTLYTWHVSQIWTKPNNWVKGISAGDTFRRLPGRHWQHNTARVFKMLFGRSISGSAT
eukprot:5263454-Pyramimonas_sp.AAC.1